MESALLKMLWDDWNDGGFRLLQQLVDKTATEFQRMEALVWKKLTFMGEMYLNGIACWEIFCGMKSQSIIFHAVIVRKLLQTVVILQQSLVGQSILWHQSASATKTLQLLKSNGGLAFLAMKVLKIKIYLK